MSHIKRLPYGRIDDDTYQVKEKGKRGRKKKVFTFDEEEYIATRKRKGIWGSTKVLGHRTKQEDQFKRQHGYFE